MDRLESERANLESCVRCGLCLESCPTYVITGLEEHNPRGRVATALAVLDGRLEMDRTLAAEHDACLVCEACTSVCPTGVQMEPIQVAMRSRIAQELTPRPAAQLVTRALRILGNRERLERWVRGLGRVRQTGLLALADRVGLLDALGISPDALPDVPSDFVRGDDGGWHPADGATPRGTVELFVGCLMSTLMAPITEATGELLAAAGYTVRRTAGQVCCGALSAHGGDPATAERAARRNVEAFRQGDAPIAVNSAGCSAFLKQYAHLLDGTAADIPNRTVDLSELLAAADLDLSANPFRGRLAFQDPCHLRSAQGIVDPPRQLLSRLPGVEVVELSEPTMCCGSAGAYSLLHPEEAALLSARKVADIAASGAELVVTANPGCLMQLRGAVARAGLDLPVRHLAEVLRDACPTTVVRADPPIAV